MLQAPLCLQAIYNGFLETVGACVYGRKGEPVGKHRAVT